MSRKVKLLLLISFFFLTGCSKEATLMAGVVPHHLVASSLIENFFVQLSQERPTIETFVIVGPNHFDRGEENILYKDEKTEEIFNQEHSWKDLEPVVKTYYPKAGIIPIIVKNRTTIEETKKLAEELAQISKRKNAFVLGSIDFSHYLLPAEAEQKDEITWQAIEKRDIYRIKNFNNDYLDSPPTLIALLLAFPQTKIELLEHTNSGKLIGDSQSPSTSYFTFFFRSGEVEEK